MGTINRLMFRGNVGQEPGQVGRTVRVSGKMADVAGEMLKAGIAVTLPDDTDRRIPTYAQLEREARKSYRGIWARTFQMP
ncbi:thermonuclease family protein [Mesorhizobium sp. 43Arga]